MGSSIEYDKLIGRLSILSIVDIYRVHRVSFWFAMCIVRCPGLVLKQEQPLSIPDRCCPTRKPSTKFFSK